MTMLCCQLVKKGRFVVANPWFEPGSPLTVHDPTRWMGDAGRLVLVEQERGMGRILEVLGETTSIHAAMRGLLAEAGRLGDAPAPGGEVGAHAPDVLEQLSALPEEIPFLDTREDLRGTLAITIDPPTAKDHDDAIGVEAAPAGADHAWVLWVHIADVAAYVPTGSPIDLDALDRAMSAYVPGTVAPMLPFELSSDLCSLRPGVDRGCLSVRAELDSDGAVVRRRFARTIVRSARRLAYDQVDQVLQGERTIDPVMDDQLAELERMTSVLRRRRMARGALDMQLPEVEIALGEERVEDAIASAESVSHRLVEECMLVANELVGARLAEADAPGIWRIHDHPDPQAIAALFKVFDALGVPTPPLPETMTGRQAAKLAAEAAAAAARYAKTAHRGQTAFVPRVLRALQHAEYRAKTGPHSGLATEHYAHFTSPIRRYPDLVVHRSLLALIGEHADEPASSDVHLIAEHVSEVERELQGLERRAHKLALASLLHRRLHGEGVVGEQEDGSWRGEVTGLVGGGLFVRFGTVFEGFVPARTLAPGERYELDETALAMVGMSSGYRIRLGDPIDVYVDRVDTATGRVDLRRVFRPGDAGAGGGGGSRGGTRAGARGGTQPAGGKGRKRRSGGTPKRGGSGGGGGRRGRGGAGSGR